MKNLLVLSGVCLAAGLLATTARAYTATGTILVSVTVPKACTISSSNLGFGIYASAQLDAAGTVTVTCTSTTLYQVGINAGANNSGNFNWNMIGPAGALLSYKIYVDAGRTTYWGGNPGSDAVAGTGTGAAQAYTAYGRVAAGQYVAAGAYTDTITFTLYY